MSTTVAALFDSQQEAQSAIDAVAKKSYADELEFTVIEDADETAAASAFPGGSGTVGLSPPVTVVRSQVAALDVDDDVMPFLRRGVQRGGVVVAVEGDDEYADEIESTMREHGAQFEETE